ncbi:MAG: hypothetical protein ACI36Z_01315 [Alloprevotella sp.]
MATNFAGILSRKAGKTMNVNNQSAAAQVANPEVAVAVVEAPAPKPRRTTPTRQEAKDELRSRAQDVAPIPTEESPATKSRKVPGSPENSTKVRKSPGKSAKVPESPEKSAMARQEKPRLTLMKYSERCMALFGDTKPIKDQLKKLGGRYNPHLHPFGQDTSVPGWVFPMKCEDDLRKLVG